MKRIVTRLSAEAAERPARSADEEWGFVVEAAVLGNSDEEVARLLQGPALDGLTARAVEKELKTTTRVVTPLQAVS